MWTVIIIILVIAMMVGPIMIMQPSKQQKRLAALRMKAQKMGLRVNGSSVKTQSGQPCWFYWLAISENTQLAPVSLQRKNYDHGLHIAKHWALEGSALESTTADVTYLESFLETLPNSVFGVEINDHALGVYWSEQGGEAVLDQLYAAMEELLH